MIVMVKVIMVKKNINMIKMIMMMVVVILQIKLKKPI